MTEFIDSVVIILGMLITFVLVLWIRNEDLKK